MSHPAPKFPAKVMTWGAFSIRGQTPLFFTKKSVNSDVYMQIIDGFLLETASVLYPEGFELVQDNAPCHKSKKTLDYLAKSRICVLEWPPNSPDLNPIENLWGIIKVKLSVMKITNIAALTAEIERIWNGFGPDFLTPFVESMPRRIQACIDADGQTIKY